MLLLCLAQVGVDADVVLALVLAQVEDFEGAVVLALGLQLALHADHALAGGVDGELAQVGDDPLAAQLLRHRGGGAGAAEEVGDEIAFVGGGFDDAFEQGFGFLGWVANVSSRACEFTALISAQMSVNWHRLLLHQDTLEYGRLSRAGYDRTILPLRFGNSSIDVSE